MNAAHLHMGIILFLVLRYATAHFPPASALESHNASTAIGASGAIGNSSTGLPSTGSATGERTTGAPNSTVSLPSQDTAALHSAPIFTFTQVVSRYTTFCPSPTTFVQNNQTYTVTAPTTLTITNCPCTISTALPEAAMRTVTQVVSAYTTYCPSPTTFTEGDTTYTVTAPTTLTISSCPCTITTVLPASTVRPVSLSTATLDSGEAAIFNASLTHEVTGPTTALIPYPLATDSILGQSKISSRSSGSDSEASSTTVTIVFTTYCPSATIFETRGQTYTASGATTFVGSLTLTTMASPSSKTRPAELVAASANGAQASLGKLQAAWVLALALLT